MIFASKSFVLSSVLGLEAFADTGNPGYYIIKGALWLMAILIIAQVVIEIVRSPPADDT